MTSPNPYFRNNFLEYYYYETKDVVYRTTFNVSKSFLASGFKRYLRFQGLDTHCHVLLNGEKIFTSRNMYVEHRALVDLKENNEIRVEFNSSANYDIEMAKAF